MLATSIACLQSEWMLYTYYGSLEACVWSVSDTSTVNNSTPIAVGPSVHTISGVGPLTTQGPKWNYIPAVDMQVKFLSSWSGQTNHELDSCTKIKTDQF